MLIPFGNIIGDMVSNEKLQPILIELFSRSRKLTIISTHIYSAWFAVLHCILSTSNRSFFYFLLVSGVWQIFFPKTTSIFWTLFVPNSYMLRFCIDGLINCFSRLQPKLERTNTLNWSFFQTLDRFANYP